MNLVWVMDRNRKNILVAWDFQEPNELSLQHALQLARVVDNDICLVHLIKETGFFGNIKEQKELVHHKKSELHAVAGELSKKFGHTIHYAVNSGKLPAIFKKLEENLNATLLVAPFQYVTDNYKLDVFDFVSSIKETNIPIITSRVPPLHSKYRELVVPVEHNKKFKEELKWIIYLAKYFKCNVNLIRPSYNDGFKNRSVQNNIYFSKKLLEANNLIYGIKAARKNVDFGEELILFTKDIEADLVIVMAHKLPYYMKCEGAEGEDIFSFPVMCVNPRADLKKLQGFY